MKTNAGGPGTFLPAGRVLDPEAREEVAGPRSRQEAGGDGNGLDASRFSHLVEPHLDVLHRLARRLTRTRADAEDLAQEALLRAFERRASLRDATRLRAWILALVRNLHLNRVRDHKPHLLVLAGHDPEEVAQDRLQGDLERDILDRHLPDELLLALRDLPEEQSTAIWLREVEGLSYEELAVAMECPIGTVRSRLARARKGLLERLEDHRAAGGV